MVKMATSILDYVFRELSISYLDRYDLGHVAPEDLLADTTGHGAKSKGRNEAGEAISAATLAGGMSRGFGRGGLRLVSGGAGQDSRQAVHREDQEGEKVAEAVSGQAGAVAGATATPTGALTGTTASVATGMLTGAIATGGVAATGSRYGTRSFYCFRYCF